MDVSRGVIWGEAMSKIEITYEMAERSLVARNVCFRAGDFKTIERERAYLEAALNPPQKPEIVVTNEMLTAGARAFMTNQGARHPDHWLTEAYRAMRNLEPKLERRSGENRRHGQLPGTPFRRQCIDRRQNAPAR